MLTLEIKEKELYDEKNQTFLKSPKVTLQLEHSLVSISKWESKHHKPFLKKDEKTPEELLDYIKCMTITQNVDDIVYSSLSSSEFSEITKYIEDPMTATTFSDTKKTGKNEIITSEIIYYMMVSLNIPFECQKWHINRLLTLIKVCSEKNSPGKKMSKKEIMSNNAALNAARRAALKTKG